MRRHQAVRANCDLHAGEWEDAACMPPPASTRGCGRRRLRRHPTRRSPTVRAKGWLDEPDHAEQVFRTYIHHQSSAPAVRDFVAPCSWALAAAICGRIREADRWCSKAAATDHQFGNSLTAYQDLLLARAVIDRERFENDSARRSIEELRALRAMPTDSLRAMAEVELAAVLISEDQRADAARTLENVVVQSEISLGPRVHDAVDRAWTDLHLATGDSPRPARAPSECGPVSGATPRLRKCTWQTASRSRPPASSRRSRRHRLGSRSSSV